SGIHLIVSETGAFVRPNLDNVTSLGTGSARYSVVYAATGAINTSDAREKTPVRPLTEQELAAAIALGKELGAYKWLSSVAEKGDAARWHIGMTVQRAIAIMESYGLDPFTYGFICYDSWERTPEAISEWPDVLDEDGNVVSAGGRVSTPEREAGDMYSFRPDGLHAFILRGMVEQQANIEARLLALESK
ncbi:tail fiber domain-containing protein, partial [Cysteiniphilum sp. 6C5]|uniref:tail fiber domain-containing protein n=1 Tax=Cysteiniphilum sp. 6C5 TaxID=3453128 RepID=UPI003F85F05C